MLAFVVVLQVLVALFLIMVVLLQPGNRGGASAALGGAGSDTVFGARGANTFLSKITFGAAILFMVTNLIISMMSSANEKTVFDKVAPPVSTKAAPEAAAPSGEIGDQPAAGAPAEGQAPAAEGQAPAAPSDTPAEEKAPDVKE